MVYPPPPYIPIMTPLPSGLGQSSSSDTGLTCALCNRGFYHAKSARHLPAMDYTELSDSLLGFVPSCRLSIPFRRFLESGSGPVDSLVPSSGKVHRTCRKVMEKGGNFVSIGGSKKSITFPATPEGFSIYRHASSEITEKIGEAGSSGVGAEMYRNLLKRLAQGELVLRSQLKTEFDNNNAAEFTTSATKSPSFRHQCYKFRKDFSKAIDFLCKQPWCDNNNTPKSSLQVSGGREEAADDLLPLVRVVKIRCSSSAIETLIFPAVLDSSAIIADLVRRLIAPTTGDTVAVAGKVKEEKDKATKKAKFARNKMRSGVHRRFNLKNAVGYLRNALRKQHSEYKHGWKARKLICPEIPRNRMTALMYLENEVTPEHLWQSWINSDLRALINALAPEDLPVRKKLMMAMVLNHTMLPRPKKGEWNRDPPHITVLSTFLTGLGAPSAVIDWLSDFGVCSSDALRIRDLERARLLFREWFTHLNLDLWDMLMADNVGRVIWGVFIYMLCFWVLRLKKDDVWRAEHFPSCPKPRELVTPKEIILKARVVLPYSPLDEEDNNSTCCLETTGVDGVVRYWKRFPKRLVYLRKDAVAAAAAAAAALVIVPLTVAQPLLPAVLKFPLPVAHDVRLSGQCRVCGRWRLLTEVLNPQSDEGYIPHAPLCQNSKEDSVHSRTCRAVELNEQEREKLLTAAPVTSKTHSDKTLKSLATQDAVSTTTQATKDFLSLLYNETYKKALSFEQKRALYRIHMAHMLSSNDHGTCGLLDELVGTCTQRAVVGATLINPSAFDMLAYIVQLPESYLRDALLLLDYSAAELSTRAPRGGEQMASLPLIQVLYALEIYLLPADVALERRQRRLLQLSYYGREDLLSLCNRHRVAHEDNDSDDTLRTKFREFLQNPDLAAEKYDAQQARRSSLIAATSSAALFTPCLDFEPTTEVEIVIPPECQTLFWGDTLGDEEIVALSDFQVCLVLGIVLFFTGKNLHLLSSSN